jgi:3-deoxy-D-manno-octulosonate 8-phosphate phosphatase (KDO 8-P phosphatase)
VSARELASAREPASAAAPDLIAEPIAILFLDVDGVLADGGISLAEGIELKRFAARDGVGAFLAHRAGLKLMIVTFRESEAVRRRAEELAIEALQGVRDKGKAVRDACTRLGIPLRAAAFMGDDLVDLEAMRVVGLAVAPSDAAPPALHVAQIVTATPGGQGAVREAIETILWLNQALAERTAASAPVATKTAAAPASRPRKAKAASKRRPARRAASK